MLDGASAAIAAVSPVDGTSDASEWCRSRDDVICLHGESVAFEAGGTGTLAAA